MDLIEPSEGVRTKSNQQMYQCNIIIYREANKYPRALPMLSLRLKARMRELLHKEAPSTDLLSSRPYALWSNFVNTEYQKRRSCDLQSNSKYDGLRGVTTGSSSGSCCVDEVSNKFCHN